MENLTPDRAIRFGYIVINVPVIIIFLIGLIGNCFLFVKFEYWLILAIGIPLTFIFVWLLWSFIFSEWKIWAFTHCRNVHELKRKAINSQLIWPDGSKAENYVYRTSSQRNKLIKLKEKFKVEDLVIEIKDDGNLPEELQIYYSRVSRMIVWVSIITALTMAIYLIFEEEIIGYLLLVISALALYYTYTNPKPKEPYLILNNKGIKLIGKRFVNWNKIKNEEIKLIGFGDSAKWYLHINMKSKQYLELEINDLTESPKNIEKLIKIYKQRNKKNR